MVSIDMSMLRCSEALTMLMRDLIEAAGHSAEPTDADEPTTDFPFVIAMGSSKVKIVCDQ